MGKISSRLKRKLQVRAKHSIKNQKKNPKKVELLKKLIRKYKT